MRLGSHQSIADGLAQAVSAARRDGCEALQIFTRNQSQWLARPLADEAVAGFREALSAWGVPASRLLAHASYLINVCGADPELARKSETALIDELGRCARLGIPYLVLHPGAHLGQGEPAALARGARAISRALAATAGPEAAAVLLENTAGQGTCVGHRFEHLRDLLADIEPRERVFVCIDTQHAFAAGYELGTEEGYERTFEALGRAVGLEQVRAFHLNDSKRELGARVDRHEAIGRGHIGSLCFRLLVNDARFAELPGVLELPPPYPPLLARLRRLADGRATARRRPPRARSAGG